MKNFFRKITIASLMVINFGLLSDKNFSACKHDCDLCLGLNMSLDNGEANGNILCKECAQNPITCKECYKVDNGLIGLNRNIIMRLIKICKNDDKTRAVIGIGQIFFNWSKERIFTNWARQPIGNDFCEFRARFNKYYQYAHKHPENNDVYKCKICAEDFSYKSASAPSTAISLKPNNINSKQGAFLFKKLIHHSKFSLIKTMISYLNMNRFEQYFPSGIIIFVLKHSDYKNFPENEKIMLVKMLININCELPE
ncbi:hypothetical protein FACS189465_2490 [Clostridia bacterium]|nr:hypothetical protein FACS189465_2490 [Clostridia bacterium]